MMRVQLFWMITSLLIFSFCPNAEAIRVYVGGAPGTVGVVDQHPVARGEARYDTNPATGLYNRKVDVLNQRYDAYADYLAFTNGDWYCTPTSALSLVHYWDQWDGADPGNQPDFPNLFAGADTDRSVVLEIAGFMDTDDWAVAGGNDVNEVHLGTLRTDILPGLSSYFDRHYPATFMGGEFSPGGAQGVGGIQNFGTIYDALINRNIPLILSLPGHSTVGIGYNDAFAANLPAHYMVNDPWDGSANISGQQLGLGRPVLGDRVFGGLNTELYGTEVDVYNESEQTNYPLHAVWIRPIPEPTTLLLLGSGLIGLAWIRRHFN